MGKLVRISLALSFICSFQAPSWSTAIAQSTVANPWITPLGAFLDFCTRDKVALNLEGVRADFFHGMDLTQPETRVMFSPILKALEASDATPELFAQAGPELQAQEFQIAFSNARREVRTQAASLIGEAASMHDIVSNNAPRVAHDLFMLKTFYSIFLLEDPENTLEQVNDAYEKVHGRLSQQGHRELADLMQHTAKELGITSEEHLSGGESNLVRLVQEERAPTHTEPRLKPSAKREAPKGPILAEWNPDILLLGFSDDAATGYHFQGSSPYINLRNLRVQEVFEIAKGLDSLLDRLPHTDAHKVKRAMRSAADNFNLLLQRGDDIRRVSSNDNLIVIMAGREVPFPDLYTQTLRQVLQIMKKTALIPTNSSFISFVKGYFQNQKAAEYFWERLKSKGYAIPRARKARLRWLSTTIDQVVNQK